MSIVRHASSPNWYYSFQLKGKKHFGSTGTGNKTVAKKVEDGERRKAIEASLSDKAEPITLKAAIQQFLDSKRGNSEYGNIKARANKLLGLSLIHISEPTRLGMISYAVFCLKKKNK